MADEVPTSADTDDHLIRDAAYETISRDDFGSMIDIVLYDKRSQDFNKIIPATHDHFWDPNDKNYVDFDQPFDMEK